MLIILMKFSFVPQTFLSIFFQDQDQDSRMKFIKKSYASYNKDTLATSATVAFLVEARKKRLYERLCRFYSRFFRETTEEATVVWCELFDY